jgi:histidyl-tRNA synthetase
MITKQKGTIDIYGDYAKKWLYVEDIIKTVMEKYNYSYIRTPLFEATELFHRSVGDATDIVTKETYDFQDRGDRNITLRPEGTAGVVRAYIENKFYGEPNQPTKLFYMGPMYRYERPQSGRLREFSQYGCEVFGTNDPAMDAEIIALAVTILNILGLKGVKARINSLGDTKSRDNYRSALIKYLEPHLNELCEDCQERFKKNPLRILDCKIDGDKDIIKKAPKTIDYLTKEDKERFNTVLKYLDLMEIPYIIDAKVVRGLDYYNHTVFELVADIPGFDPNFALGGGGRYNSMVSELDGPQTSAMGFAGGMDRLLLAIDSADIKMQIKDNIDIYLMYVNDEEKDYAIALNQVLRVNGFTTDMEYTGRALKAQFKQADRLKARYLIILNSNDIKEGKVQLKDNLTKEENKISESELVDYLDMNL